MIKVKIKTKRDRSFSLPVPYLFLRAGGSLLMSKFVLDQLNKALQDKKSPVRIPPLDKKAFLPLLGELKKHKGLTLVDARLGDGTKVIVRL